MELSVFLHITVISIWGMYPVLSLPLEALCLIQDHLSMSMEECPLLPYQAQRPLQVHPHRWQVAMELFHSISRNSCLVLMRVSCACQGLQVISMLMGPITMTQGLTFSEGYSKVRLFLGNSRQKLTFSVLSLEGGHMGISKSRMIGPYWQIVCLIRSWGIRWNWNHHWILVPVLESLVAQMAPDFVELVTQYRFS